MLQGNSEKTAVSKGFSCIKQVGYHLGLPPVTKIPFPKRAPDRKTRAAATTEAAKQWANKYGEERNKLQIREGSYSIKEMNRKEVTGKEKKASKKIALRKKITSFIKKYHSWPATLNIRRYQKGNTLLLLHFYKHLFFNIIHLWHKHFQGLAWISHMYKVEPARFTYKTRRLTQSKNYITSW